MIYIIHTIYKKYFKNTKINNLKYKNFKIFQKYNFTITLSKTIVLKLGSTQVIDLGLG